MKLFKKNSQIDRQIEEQQEREKQKQLRVKRCQEKIEEVLRRENCVLSVSMIITERGNIPQILILPKD